MMKVLRTCVRPFIILMLLGAAILLVYYFYDVRQQTVIFTHFFYIPIILAALWWGWRGIGVPLALVVLLVVGAIFWPVAITLEHYTRMAFFLVIFAVVTFLRDRALSAEQKANQYRSELAHADRLSVLGTTIAELAHELNQPLCAVRTTSSACRRMLQSGDINTGELISSLEQVDRQTERAAGIIRHIRDFAKKEQSSYTRVDISATVHHALELVRNLDRVFLTIPVRVSVDDTLPLVQGDPLQIEQVLVNIMHNAFEAMAASNSIRDKELSVKTFRDQARGYAGVRIEDTGQGVDQETFKRLFEPFFTTKSKGLGLGLAISRSIIEAHGGMLWAEKKSPQGLIFHLQLPINNQGGL